MFQVNSEAGGMLFEPRVAMDRAGNFVVAWERYSDHHYLSDFGIFAQRYDVSGDKTLEGDLHRPAVPDHRCRGFVTRCFDAEDGQLSFKIEA